MSTLNALIGLGIGAIALVLAVYFLPILRPIGQWFGDNIPEFMDYIKDGLSTIGHKGSSIVTVALIATIGYLLGSIHAEEYTRDKVIKELRQDYRFVPRKK